MHFFRQAHPLEPSTVDNTVQFKETAPLIRETYISINMETSDGFTGMLRGYPNDMSWNVFGKHGPYRIMLSGDENSLDKAKATVTAAVTYLRNIGAKGH